MRFRKSERSAGSGALIEWFKKEKSDSVSATGPLLIITFVSPKFLFQVNIFLASICMEIYNYRRVIFIISKF